MSRDTNHLIEKFINREEDNPEDFWKKLNEDEKKELKRQVQESKDAWLISLIETFEPSYSIDSQDNIEFPEKPISLTDMVITQDLEGIELSLNNLDSEQRKEAIVLIDEDGYSPLISGILTNNPKVICTLLTGLSPKQRMEAILSHDSNGYTTLTHGVLEKSHKMVEILLDGLDSEQIFEAITFQDGQGFSGLIRTAKENNPLMITALFKGLDPEQMFAAILSEDKYGNTVFLEALQTNNSKMLKALLINLSEEYKQKLLVTLVTTYLDEIYSDDQYTKSALKNAYTSLIQVMNIKTLINQDSALGKFFDNPEEYTKKIEQLNTLFTKYGKQEFNKIKSFYSEDINILVKTINLDVLENIAKCYDKLLGKTSQEQTSNNNLDSVLKFLAIITIVPAIILSIKSLVTHSEEKRQLNNLQQEIKSIIKEFQQHMPDLKINRELQISRQNGSQNFTATVKSHSPISPERL